MRKKDQFDTAENRERLYNKLSTHIGKHNAISMTALFEEVFNLPWENRVNDTRPIRRLVKILQYRGVPICSTTQRDGGGYYLPAAGSETVDFLRKKERHALTELKTIAAIKKTSLPNYLGQLKIEMETK